jgi:chromate transporter
MSQNQATRDPEEVAGHAESMDAVLPDRLPLASLGAIFLRLGMVGFGGPAAHLALMHEEFVHRRRWIGEQEFLDLNAVTNMIPGPSSTEMAVHIGHRLRGLPGMIVAGTCFILPAAIIVMVLGIWYRAMADSPVLAGVLAGLKPVTVALVLVAIVRLAPAALMGATGWTIALAAVGLRLLGLTEIVIFVTAAAGMIAWRQVIPKPAGTDVRMVFGDSGKSGSSGGLGRLAVGLGVATAALLVLYGVRPDLVPVLGAFLKVGSVVYGSGYVLLPFLETELVVRQGWLTSQQVLDSVSVAQLTPGPLFTGATFAGFLIGGPMGALVASVGIFLPGFVLVALTARHIPKLRQNRILANALDGINPAAIGLMAGVLLTLGREAVQGPHTLVWALAAAGLLHWTRIHPMILLGSGAMVGGWFGRFSAAA